MTDPIENVSASIENNLKASKEKIHKPITFKNPKYQKIYDWLCQTYPKVFIPTDVKILERGIRQKILEGDDLPFSKTHLGQFLARYCGSRVYLKRLIDVSHRTNLEGEEIAELTEEEKEAARLQLKENHQKPIDKTQQEHPNADEEKASTHVPSENISGTDAS